MATDYAKIREENLRKYGTEIDRVGSMLLAHRYADRTHFVYELLQNAEDALAWLSTEGKKPKSRTVAFDLHSDALRFTHYGLPFAERHVRGICGVGESTKTDELTTIGRFGIGFKAVYAFTRRPEIHSGDEHFAITSYVRPEAVAPVPVETGRTLFHIPLSDAKAAAEIASKLKSLGHRTLLFLRQIDAIEWHAPDGTGGIYLRESTPLGDNCHRVVLIGQDAQGKDEEERWLVFAREVFTPAGAAAGRVEIAFSLDTKAAGDVIQSIADSDLVVFFPTDIDTNLGFLVQGPYCTTPSRDNVPKDNDWNRHLVEETAKLVQESLVRLRDMGLLTVDVLAAMPIVPEKFRAPPTQPGQDKMFKPVFDAVKQSLLLHDLLPCFGGGHVAAVRARLARADAVRRLFSPDQLALLLGSDKPLRWISGDITQARAAVLRSYLIQELSVPEIDGPDLVRAYSQTFAKAQSDEWMASFYAYLSDVPALWRLGGFRDQPIIRLESGDHVVPFDQHKHPRAYLPGGTGSGFPTVRRAICANGAALEFLKQLGLSGPDPVDDVIEHVLPRLSDVGQLSDRDYAHAIGAVLEAFKTDSASRRDALLVKLGETPFVRSREAASGIVGWKKPGDVYLPTEKLLTLFKGTHDIWFVDDKCESLRGEEVRKFLERAGVRDYIRRLECDTYLDEPAKAAIRLRHGAIKYSSHRIWDYDILGMALAVQAIGALAGESAAAAACNLWSTLLDAQRDGRDQYFLGQYAWGFMHDRYEATFPARFVRTLQETAWVPAPSGQLVCPRDICFSDTPPGMRNQPSPFLQKLLGFKPEIIQQLAKEAGIDPSALDLLKQFGLDREKLTRILQEANVMQKPADAVASILGPVPAPTPPPADPPVPPGFKLPPVDTPNPSATTSGGTDGGPGKPDKPAGRDDGTVGPQQGPQYVTYIYTAPVQPGGGSTVAEEGDRDTTDQAGIAFVLKWEADTGKRFPTPLNHTNKGYDIESRDATGAVARFIEVKSLKSALGAKGVTLSDMQFAAARKLGGQYWLYIVEGAQTQNPRLVRIQDPASSLYFVYNEGWRVRAESDPKPAAPPNAAGEPSHAPA